MKRPEITVAVCTYNRYSVLPKCLASLESQTLAVEDYEVLIVDNSDDRAARDAFWSTMQLASNFRLIKVERSGLSHARNVAFSEAASPRVAFIDDDALACPGWAEALVQAFNAPSEPTVVFGPVRPIWPNGRKPRWVAPEFQAAFTILDLGPHSRAVGDGEHGYGANVAFSVAHARQAGGFLETLGRNGKSLMSGEDLHLQSRMQDAGQIRYYAADAIVDHHVHQDRLSRSWLFARFAWQAVNERIEGTDWSGAESALQALTSGQYGEETTDFFGALFKDDGPDYPHLSQQLGTVKNVVAALLALGDLDEQQLVELERDVPVEPSPLDEHLKIPFRWAPAIAPNTRLLVVEGAGNRGHNYLVPPLRLLPNVQELAIHIPVDAPCVEYDGLFDAVAGRNCTLFLPTLENHLFWLNRANFTGMIERHAVGIAGILHRLPETEADERALLAYGPRLKAVFVLASQIEHTLRERFGLDRVYTLPHLAHHAEHMTLSRSEARRRLGIPEDAVVLAQMGEQRAGKGLDHVLKALPHLSEDVKRRLFLLLVGKAPQDIISAAEQTLAAEGIAYRLDLRDNETPGDYVVMGASDYATRIVAADFGCLLFDGPQRDVMSGAFSDYLTAGVGIIAAVDTVVGDAVAEHGAGHVVSIETPEKLANALDDILGAPERLDRHSPPVREYLRQIDPQNIAAIIASALDIDLESRAADLAAPTTNPARASVQT